MMDPPIPAQHSEPDLVLLHGWGMNAAVWKDVSRDLRGTAVCHPIELPGHGDRPFSPRSPDLWSWADACLEAAPDRALWLGWSLGGLIALTAALRAPERVEGLILVTATPRFVQAADWAPAMPAETLRQFHAAFALDPAATLTRFLALQVRGSERARETMRILRARNAGRPTPDPDALLLGLELLREGDLRGRLPDIGCPALWLFGTRDTLVPAAAAGRVELLMPGARTAIIQGAAHAPQLSHPRQTHSAIQSFLASRGF